VLAFRGLEVVQAFLPAALVLKHRVPKVLRASLQLLQRPLDRLPSTLFTLLAALLRVLDIRPQVVRAGLLTMCVERFVLRTSDARTDTKVRRARGCADVTALS
jgi:hypothetical protein